MWSRTVRFSNPHAHCAIDGLLSIFWFSAWASLASYVLSGKGKGDVKNASGCDNFAHGNAAKCKISEADIFLSVLMMCCFITSSFFSFKVLMEYRRTGIAPNAVYIGGGEKAAKENTSHLQSAPYKEDDEAFDSRLDVREGGRDIGYSFEDTRVQGGAHGVGYGGSGVHAPYGGYSSVPDGDDTAYNNGRPTSFGGPLNGNRV